MLDVRGGVRTTAVLSVLAGLLAVAPGAPAASHQASNRCEPGSTVVAKAPLVTRDGRRVGKVRLLALDDGRWCGEVRVAKAYLDTALSAETSLAVTDAQGVSTYVAGDQADAVECLVTDALASGDRVAYRASLRGTALQARAAVRATAP